MDKHDIPFLVKDLSEIMPTHTDNSFRIPKCQFGVVPKNMMDLSSHKMNKTLNNFQSDIEEINFKFPSNPIPKQILMHNVKYYGARDILNHDGFYQRFLEWQKYNGNDPMIKGGGGGGMRGVFINFGSVAQSEIVSETQGTTALSTGMGGDILGSKGQSSATVGNWLSEIAGRMDTAAGAQIMGIFTDNSNTPDARVGYTNTSGIALDTSYSYQSLVGAPITITSAVMWAYIQSNSNSSKYAGATSGMTMKYPTSGWAFGIPNSSWGTSNTGTYAAALKFRGV